VTIPIHPIAASSPTPWGVGVLIALFLMVVIPYGIGKFLQVRRRRREVAARPHMGTEEFLASIGVVPGHEGVYVAMREAMAGQAKVPVETIYPNDTIEFLYSLTFDGFDTVEIVIALENQLSIYIPDETAEKIPFPHDSTTLAACARGLIECEELMSLVPS
jgi:acyl carrier protein